MLDLDKKIIQIREIILKSKNPIMFFDTDADGTTSYFQLKKAFPKIKGYYMSREFQLKSLEFIKEKNDLIIIFDIPFINEEFFKETKSKTIIWADHHLTNQKDLIIKYKINHLNPLEYDKSDNRPSSFLAYKIANLKENLPLAVLGSVADFFVLDIIIDLYNFDIKSFNLLFKINENKKLELFKFLKSYKFNDEKKRKERTFWVQYLTYECGFSDFKNLFDLMYKLDTKKNSLSINDAIKLLEKMSIFEIKSNLNSGKGFLFEDFKLMKKKYKLIFKKTILKLEKDKNFNSKKDLILFEYSGKISFTRQIAEELSFKYSNFKIIAVIFKKYSKQDYNASFRGNGFDVNKLITTCLENLNGRGGGHKYAAGMKINKSDYEKFKNRIYEQLNEFK